MSRKPVPAQAVRPKRGSAPGAGGTPEIVDPVWLLKAFGVTVLVALLCAYLTLCGLFYRGQWQLVLHPVRTSAPPSTVGGVPFEAVRFGAGATGIPQLTGWWIAPRSNAAYGQTAILYLPGADGSLADQQATLAALCDAGVAVFAIDYRGYGQSAAIHPSQATMSEDAETAWQYLVGSGRLQPGQIVPYGTGVGAALALSLASAHTAAPAVILDNPDFHVEDRVRNDPRATLIPVGLLFRNQFSLSPRIEHLRIPKLIFSRSEEQGVDVRRAADPKMTVTDAHVPGASYVPAIRRFLDQYASHAAVSPGALSTQMPQ